MLTRQFTVGNGNINGADKENAEGENYIGDALLAVQPGSKKISDWQVFLLSDLVLRLLIEK